LLGAAGATLGEDRIQITAPPHSVSMYAVQ
jgi:hypothetical protein